MGKFIEQVKLVGGPAAGQWVEVHDKPERYRVEVMHGLGPVGGQPAAELPYICTEMYIRRELRDPLRPYGPTWVVYIHHAVSDFLAELLRGYGREAEELQAQAWGVRG